MATRKKPSKKETAEAVTDEQPVEVAAESQPVVVEEESTELPPLKQEPNVIWRGDKEPPSVVRIGIDRIDLPAAEAQRAGFFSPDAKRLVRQIKGYKHLNNLKP